MAICRFGDESDVYVYEDIGGGFTCCGCPIANRADVNVPTASEMIVHLQEHQGLGHKVPAAAFDKLSELVTEQL